MHFSICSFVEIVLSISKYCELSILVMMFCVTSSFELSSIAMFALRTSVVIAKPKIRTEQSANQSIPALIVYRAVCDEILF